MKQSLPSSYGENFLENSKDMSISILYQYLRNGVFKEKVDEIFENYNKRNNVNISFILVFDILQSELKQGEGVNSVNNFFNDGKSLTKLKILLNEILKPEENIEELVTSYIEGVKSKVSFTLDEIKNIEKEKDNSNEQSFQLFLNIPRGDFIDSIHKFSQSEKQKYFDEIYEHILSNNIYIGEETDKVIILSEVLHNPLLKKRNIHSYLSDLYNQDNYILPITFIKKLYHKLLEIRSIELKQIPVPKTVENIKEKVPLKKAIQNVIPLIEVNKNTESDIELNNETISENNSKPETKDSKKIKPIVKKNIKVENSNEGKKIVIGRQDDIGNNILSKMLDHTILTAQEEYDLMVKIKAGDKRSINVMIEHNIKLVASIAKPFIGRGIEKLDLIQEGCLSLHTAIEKFDHNKGYKFSTYATWWIRQSMQSLVSRQYSDIGVSINKYQEEKKFWFRYNKLKEELRRNPSIEELSNDLNLPEKTIQKLLISYKSVIELDKEINHEDGNSSQHDIFIPDGNKPLEEQVFADYDSEKIHQLLSGLPEREKTIIINRFGLLGGETQTLEELGNMIGLNRERIRQLEKSTLKKLKKILERPSNVCSVIKTQHQKNIAHEMKSHGNTEFEEVIEDNNLVETVEKVDSKKIKPIVRKQQEVGDGKKGKNISEKSRNEDGVIKTSKAQEKNVTTRVKLTDENKAVREINGVERVVNSSSHSANYTKRVLNIEGFINYINKIINILGVEKLGDEWLTERNNTQFTISNFAGNAGEVRESMLDFINPVVIKAQRFQNIFKLIPKKYFPKFIKSFLEGKNNLSEKEIKDIIELDGEISNDKEILESTLLVENCVVDGTIQEDISEELQEINQIVIDNETKNLEQKNKEIEECYSMMNDKKNAELEVLYRGKNRQKNKQSKSQGSINKIVVQKDHVSIFIKKLAYQNKREQMHFFTYIALVIKRKKLVQDTPERSINYDYFPPMQNLLSHFFVDLGSYIEEKFVHLLNPSSKFKIFKDFLKMSIEPKLRKHWDILEMGNYRSEINYTIPLEIDGYSRYKFPFTEQDDQEWYNFAQSVIDYKNEVPGSISPEVLVRCKRSAIQGINLGSDIKRKKKGQFRK